MKKNILITLFLVSVLLISGCYRTSEKNENYGNKNDDSEDNDNYMNGDDDINPDNYASDVFITSSGFMPSEVRVRVGSEVTWINEDNQDHVIETIDSSYASDELAKGDSVTFKFDKPGRYEYISRTNPNLKGVVIVE